VTEAEELDLELLPVIQSVPEPFLVRLKSPLNPDASRLVRDAP
jgi:hypothetical protein